MASSQPRKPSVAPRRPSNLGSTTSSADLGRKPPKLPSRQGSEVSTTQSQPRKPPGSSRRPSNFGGKATGTIPERKAPKLGPKKGVGKGAQQSQAGQSSASQKPKPVQDAKSKQAAHRVDEEEQDLKSILSDEQCEDLLKLTAGITNRMRRTVENNFNATAGLSKIGEEKEGEDAFASVDFDPGTVDVAAYDKERKLRDERQKELSTPKVKELKKASLKWFDDWRDGFLKRVDETLKTGNKTSLQQAQQDDTEKSSLPSARPVQTMSASAKEGENVTPKLEDLFPRVPTSLTRMPLMRRSLVLHSFLLLLLSLEHYNAASRVFLLYLASTLKLGLKYLREDEEKTAKGLLEAAKQISASKETLEKGKESEESRKWKMRLATVAGAAIVGLSGGYAAPMIAATVGAMMSEMGLGASAAAGYLGTVAGNTYLVGSLFGAYGGRMTGEMMRNLSADVEDFAFLPVHGERKEHADSVEAVTDSRRLRVIISISGWLLEKEEVVTPWRVLKPSAEVFALRFELQTLMSLGQSINAMTASDAYGFAETAFTQRSMVTDLTSVIWPMALVKIARVIENPFSLAQARAEKAGKVLADALIKRTQGERPVTLIGYSVGARVIWSCLTSLAERRAFGLVESVVLLGAPVPSDIGTWRAMRTAVSGRLVNVYSKNDYLLAFLYRTSSLQYGVSGLMPISGLSGVENFDVSETVSGHLRYRYLVGSILQKIGFEDIDKDEVAIEAETFKIMSEEEEKKKPDYLQEVTKNASEIYDKYKKRGKQPPNKKVSDKDAEKQATAMEKEVQQKTQKGLMQWAVEQLYLSPPAAPSAEDTEKIKNDPQSATKSAKKSADKTVDAATKTMYQRAKEAVYISRSGGPEGADAAKDKVADAKGTAEGAVPSGYLATAAGYIPTGYLPGFGTASSAAGDPKAKAGKASKQSVGAADGKQKDAGKNVDTSNAKANGSTTKGDNPTKPKAKKRKSIAPNTKTEDTTPDTAAATAGAQESTDEAPAEGDTPDAAEQATAQDRKDDQIKGGEPAPSSSGGYTSYLPSFGYHSSSSSKPSAKTPDSDESAKAAREADKGPGEDQHAGGDLTDTTPTNSSSTKANEKEEEKSQDKGKAKAHGGYGSYIPSFGWGSSSGNKKAAKPDDSAKAKKSTESTTKDEDNKDVESQSKIKGTQGDAQQKSDEANNSSNESAKADSRDDNEQKEEGEDAQKSTKETESEDYQSANEGTAEKTPTENSDHKPGEITESEAEDGKKTLEDPFIE